MRPLTITTFVAACALALASCGGTVSTSGFKGPARGVAQTVADLQADVTAGEQKKVCANDLAAALVARLGGAKSCESAVKTQLGQVDNTELKIESIAVAGTTATARAQSTYSGRKRSSTLRLVKEGGRWKVSGLG